MSDEVKHTATVGSEVVSVKETEAEMTARITRNVEEELFKHQQEEWDSGIGGFLLLIVALVLVYSSVSYLYNLIF